MKGRSLPMNTSRKIYNTNKGTRAINSRPRLTRGGYVW